jgi:hypothetical protein
VSTEKFLLSFRRELWVSQAKTLKTMTLIPFLAFTANDSKKNLDTAIKFLVAGALPSPAIPANASNVPPITLQSVARGVAIALLPAFKYESMATATGDWRSKFDVIVPTNPRLEAMISDPLKAITGHVGTVNIPYLKADGVSITPAGGITTLEALIYSLAAANSDVQMTKVNIAGSVYHKITADYTFVPNTGGGNQ